MADINTRGVVWLNENGDENKRIATQAVVVLDADGFIVGASTGGGGGGGGVITGVSPGVDLATNSVLTSLLSSAINIDTKIPSLGIKDNTQSIPVTLSSSGVFQDVLGDPAAGAAAADTSNAALIPLFKRLLQRLTTLADVNVGTTADVAAAADTSVAGLTSLFKRHLQRLTQLITNVGATADASATTDTGTFSLIALTKRTLVSITSILGRLPAALGTTTSVASLPVTLPTDGVVGAAADTSATTDTGTFSLVALIKRLLVSTTTLISRTPALGVAASAAATPVTLATDGVFVNAVGNPSDTAPASDTSPSSLIGLIKRLLAGITTLISRTPVLGAASASGAVPVTMANDGVFTNSVGNPADPAAASDVGNFNMISLLKRIAAAQPLTPAGDGTFSLNRVGGGTVKASPGRVLSFMVSNTTANLRYFLFHDKASAPIVGDGALLSVVIPPNSNVMMGTDVLGRLGITFTTGVSWSPSSIPNSLATIGANELIVSIRVV